jgi:hypothetical protein
MKAGMTSIIVGILVLLVLCPIASADWTEPVPLTEVNTKYYEEWAPFLSFDKLNLYFSRVRTDIPYYGRIYQASRDEPSGPFTSIREISELNQPHTYVICPWVSPDNLRMYYHTQLSGLWQLKVSKRTSINDPWPQGTNISEINQLARLIHTPKLTADERIIFFNVREDIAGNEQHDIWMATRPDRDSLFSQVRKLDEINTGANEVHPFISADGLELYFSSDRNGTFQLLKATRESLDAPFGNVEHLSFFDTPGGHSLFPCIAGDASAFYFVREPAGRSSRDIWVSYLSEIPPPPPTTYYVDGVNGSDDNNGLTPETAFATIQKGITTAADGNSVLVFPAVYTEQIAFEGKAITVQGIATKAGIPIQQMPGDFALLFQSAEGADSVFKNFVIKNSFMAIFIAGSSPTIKNLTIVDNKYGISAFVGSEPDISNCILWNNSDSDLSGCQARYSRTSNPGEGNIDADPCFVDANNADYHLLSQRGRYWPAHDVWVLDKVTSPCVDGGDPYDNPSGEPMPNGGRIDIGAFGGTPFASLSDWPIASDANHDGKVNLADLSILCEEWLSILPWAE